MKKVSIVLIAIVLVVITLFAISRIKQNSVIKVLQSEPEQQVSLPIPTGPCPSSIETVQLFSLSMDDGHTNAEVYFKMLPHEHNNFFFDKSMTCTQPFSKMIVFGSYGENGAPQYEYTEFTSFNTWQNYQSTRSAQKDYVTNVFSVSKTTEDIILTENYQE